MPTSQVCPASACDLHEGLNHVSTLSAGLSTALSDAAAETSLPLSELRATASTDFTTNCLGLRAAPGS